ncbi:MAG: hypothetical protein AAGD25_27940 [Cyanobacteria bacterium P01_F01_bin.150]
MTTPLSEHFLKEIAIANLGPLLIVVPTDTIYLSPSKSNLKFPVPRRIYNATGWAIDGHTNSLMGTINGLQLTSPFPKDSPLQIGQCLTQNVPLSFELKSTMPFSKAIASLALFQYQFQETQTFYYGMFHNLRPSFVRIYPRQSTQEFPEQVARFLHEELHAQLQQRLQLENDNSIT